MMSSLHLRSQYTFFLGCLLFLYVCVTKKYAATKYVLCMYVTKKYAVTTSPINVECI